MVMQVSCAAYDMPSVWEYPSDKETIKSKIDYVNNTQIWKCCFQSQIVVTRLQLTTDYKPYHNFNRYLGRAILMWRTGALRFRNLYKGSFKKSGADKCPHHLCGQTDTLKHAIKCPFMGTKLNQDSNVPFEQRMSRFLMELNSERVKWFSAPIL